MIKEFFKKHGYDTALAILILVFGGSIIGLFNDVLAAFSAFPVAVSLCCGLFLFVGLGLSAVVDRRAIKIAQIESSERLEMHDREAESKRLEAKEAEEKYELNRQRAEEDRFQRIAQDVRRAHGDVKPAIVFLYDHGPVKNAFSYDSRPATILEKDMFIYEPLPGNEVMDDLAPNIRKAIDLHPEVLEETRKALKENPELEWYYFGDLEDKETN